MVRLLYILPVVRDAAAKGERKRNIGMASVWLTEAICVEFYEFYIQDAKLDHRPQSVRLQAWSTRLYQKRDRSPLN